MIIFIIYDVYYVNSQRDGKHDQLMLHDHGIPNLAKSEMPCSTPISDDL